MEKKEEKKIAQSSSKILRGVVVSDAMQDSAVVRVERYVKHPKYGKFVRQQKKYTAHDPGNTAKMGDTVTIEESRPTSKTKRFRIVTHDTNTRIKSNDTN